MKEIKLISLSLKNFKGIKEFEILDFSKNTKIFGDNGTGKTTLADAFYWLLFDKDSRGNSTQSFDIKTLDENGQVMHGLEHEVKGILSINDKVLTLKKVYYEKWTKQRGSATKTFTGHTTDYFLNEVPVKKSEYDARISEIVQEDIFKLLTNPSEFNELHWEDRRKILIEICGDITNKEVIGNSEELQDLKKILNERDVEDHKKIIASKRKKINKELEKIPVRVDEVSNSIPEIEIDKHKIKQGIGKLKSQIKKKEQELANIDNGGELAEKRKKLAEIETELLEVKNKHRGKFDSKIENKRSKLEDLKDKYIAVKSDIRGKEQEIKTGEQRIEQLDQEMVNLRVEWHELDEKKLEFDQEDVCPTCGQDIPQEQLDEAKERAVKDFNLAKSKELSDISLQGKNKKEYKEKILIKNETLQKEIGDLEIKAQEHQKKAEKIKSQIEKLKIEANQAVESKEYKTKLKDKEEVENSIEVLSGCGNAQKQFIRQDISKLEDELHGLEKKLAQF